jgi:energy-coupling factor transport system substrate-specific component
MTTHIPSADPRPPASLTRDLITVGVFTALYFVVMAVIGQLGALLPITQVFAPFFIPIVCGIPFMLFVTRVARFGMITVMGWLIGLLLLATGQSWMVLVLAVVLAVVADLIARAGAYRSWGTTLAAFIVFSEMGVGMVIPLYFQRAATMARMRAHGHDDAWVNQIVSLTPSWMFYLVIVMLAVGAVIGAHLGRAIFRKHFGYLAQVTA